MAAPLGPHVRLGLSVSVGHLSSRRLGAKVHLTQRRLEFLRTIAMAQIQERNPVGLARLEKISKTAVDTHLEALRLLGLIDFGAIGYVVTARGFEILELADLGKPLTYTLRERLRDALAGGDSTAIQKAWQPFEDCIRHLCDAYRSGRFEVALRHLETL